MVFVIHKKEQDECGEEGLKDQVPPPAGGGAGASFFSAADGPTSFRFNP